MTEPERIKNIEERIALEGLLPGVNLVCLPPGESAKLKRVALDLYRLGHASGFQAGADHAINATAGATPLLRYALKMQWLKRRLSARMRLHFQDVKNSLRSLRPAGARSPRRRFPTEALGGNWATRRRLY